MIEIKKIYVAAAIIINEEKNKILITKRQGGQFDGLWEFPGGKIENGETSKEATIREIKEELSLEIEIIDYFNSIEYQYEDFYLTMHLYWSSIKSGELSLNEHSDFLWA